MTSVLAMAWCVYPVAGRCKGMVKTLNPNGPGSVAGWASTVCYVNIQQRRWKSIPLNTRFSCHTTPLAPEQACVTIQHTLYLLDVLHPCDTDSVKQHDKPLGQIGPQSAAITEERAESNKLTINTRTPSMSPTKHGAQNQIEVIQNLCCFVIIIAWNYKVYFSK